MPAVQRARGGSGDERWEDSECRQGRWFFLVYGLYFSHKFLYCVKLGFKSKEGGLARAKAGVMRRLSMTALRSTARHVLRGLAIVGPSCIHQRNAREAARRAHLDAFGANRGAPWRDPTNGG